MTNECKINNFFFINLIQYNKKNYFLGNKLIELKIDKNHKNKFLDIFIINK